MRNARELLRLGCAVLVGTVGVLALIGLVAALAAALDRNDPIPAFLLVFAIAGVGIAVVVVIRSAARASSRVSAPPRVARTLAGVHATWELLGLLAFVAWLVGVVIAMLTRG